MLPGCGDLKKISRPEKDQEKGIDWFFFMYLPLANANDVILMPNDVVITEP